MRGEPRPVKQRDFVQAASALASHVEWSPRADDKVWMYEAKVTPR